MARPPREHLREHSDAEDKLPHAAWSETYADDPGPASVGCRLAAVSLGAGVVLAAVGITIYLFMGG